LKELYAVCPHAGLRILEMGFPLRVSFRLFTYLLGNKLKGRARFAFTLMLEPTLRCNLACIGCGRIRESKESLPPDLSVEDCLKALEESGAPAVSVSGGEPLLHPQVGEIVEQFVRRKKFTYLCTNGLLLRKSLPKFRPSPYFSFVLHLDGLKPTHERIVGLKGVFEEAIASIKEAKAAGFRVLTNTTVFKGTSPAEVEELFSLLSGLGVDGMMIAPAFNFQGIEEDLFLSPDEVRDFFQQVYQWRKKFRLYHTNLYLKFLAGEKRLECLPWAIPTRTPAGWRRPCYLLADEYCQSFAELLNETRWEAYGPGRDPRCASCTLHSGFEPGAIGAISRSPSAIWTLIHG